jgi:F-type H+-transporting ATPase subunit delta
MRGASREALSRAQADLSARTEAAGTDLTALSDDLAEIGALLGREVAVRRLLTDPAKTGEQRADLAGRLLAGKIGAPALELLTGMVRGRWSQPRDLAEAVTRLAVEAELALAEKAGELDGVEEDLFRFGRLLAAQSELASALSERTPADQRTALADSLLAGKAHASSVRLIHRAVRQPQGLSALANVEHLSNVAAELRERLTALVSTASPLTEAQLDRLTGILSRRYGRPVRLNVELDPGLIAGLSIRIGDEIIDGSLRSRLGEASRGFAA